MFEIMCWTFSHSVAALTHLLFELIYNGLFVFYWHFSMFPGFDCLNCFFLMFPLCSRRELALTDSSGGSIDGSVPVSMLA